MYLFDLTGKTAIVTGGNKGLGKGMAEGLCEAGASVVIMASSESVYEAAKELTDKGFTAYGVRCNLADEAAIEKAFAEALELLGGKLDILSVSLGYFFPKVWGAPFFDFPSPAF